MKYKYIVFFYTKSIFITMTANKTTKYVEKHYNDGGIFYEGYVSNMNNEHIERQIGCWKVYHENGKLMTRCDFSKEGLLNGLLVEYYSNGQLSFKCDFKDGKQISVAERYDENGDNINVGWNNPFEHINFNGHVIDNVKFQKEDEKKNILCASIHKVKQQKLICFC